MPSPYGFGVKSQLPDAGADTRAPTLPPGCDSVRREVAVVAVFRRFALSSPQRPDSKSVRVYVRGHWYVVRWFGDRAYVYWRTVQGAKRHSRPNQKDWYKGRLEVEFSRDRSAAAITRAIAENRIIPAHKRPRIAKGSADDRHTNEDASSRRETHGQPGVSSGHSPTDIPSLEERDGTVQRERRPRGVAPKVPNVNRRHPFSELRMLVTAVIGSDRGPRTEQAAALCRFLDALTERGRSRIVAGLMKLPRAEQARIHRVIVDHAYWLSSEGPSGPGARLLGEISDGLHAQVDSLPDPGPAGGRSRTAEEWRAIHAAHLASLLTQNGWPDALGRAAAEDLTRLDGPSRSLDTWTKELIAAGAAAENATQAVQGAHELGRFYASCSNEMGRDLDEVMRDDLIRSGLAPGDADAISADWRRNRKWLAASDAALPAKLLDDKRAAEEVIRKGCGRIAKYADAVAADLRRLATETTPAPLAASLRDGRMGELATAASAALPKSPSVFAIVQREHPGAKGSPYLWYEAVSATDELVDEIARGAPLDRVLVAAALLKTLAEEARTWAHALARGRGRPTKPGVDGAVALRAQGLTPPQIAMVLDRHDLKLDGYTPAEAARQAEKTRRRRAGTG